MEDPIKEITEFFKKQFDETLDMYKVNSYDFCTCHGTYLPEL